jgi:hypothetical protein
MEVTPGGLIEVECGVEPIVETEETGRFDV